MNTPILPSRLPHQRLAPILAILSALGLIWFLGGTLAWEPIEIGRVLVGCTALWLPLASVVYLVVSDQFDDGLSRVTFSAIASYSLTSLLYFAFSVGGTWLPGFEWLFYPAQLLALVGAFVYAYRPGLLPGPGWFRAGFWQIDWLLVTLIVAGLLVNVRYQDAFKPLPDGGRRYVTFCDETYYAALAHELGRHTPPVQTAYRAGVPDRAYHLFPFLTTMLVARATDQPDMLRAHLVYEYCVIEVLTSLALFCLARRLSGSTGAGYTAVAFLYLLALPLPPLCPTWLGFFYFSVHPHLSSNVEPAMITSPQTCSGVLVVYGVFLAVVSGSARVYRRLPAGRLALLGALLCASLVRFRIQCFLPLFPGVLLLLLAAWVRTRRPVFALAASLGLAVAVLLTMEMRLPVYFPQTASITFGNTMLSQWRMFQDWPFAADVKEWVGDLFPDSEAFFWAWQIVCLPAFTLLNVVGLPLALACACYAPTRRAWHEYAGFTWLLVCGVAGSLVGAMCVGTTYDDYSVGGQMLLHVGWYLLPLLAVGFWPAACWVGNSLRVPPWVWGTAGGTVLVAAFAYQIDRPPTHLAAKCAEDGFEISADEWAALMYMRDRLPTDAVILSSELHGSNTAVFGGIAGRAAYLEYWMSILDHIPEFRPHGHGRLETLNQLWSQLPEDEFVRLLQGTGATHLVEYASQPLQVASRPRLRRLWVSPQEKVTVW